MALRRPIAAINIRERAPHDLVVRVTFDDGTSLEVAGEDYYADGVLFKDVVDAYGFLVIQNPPQALLVQALSAFDPEWEQKVAERKRQNDRDSAVARGEPTPEEAEAKRRADLKDAFRRERRER
jgi:hypothetical protein